MTQKTDFALSSRDTLLDMPKGRWGPRQIVLIFALLFAIWHILTNVYLSEPGLWQNAIHFAGFAFIVFIDKYEYDFSTQNPNANMASSISSLFTLFVCNTK